MGVKGVTLPLPLAVGTDRANLLLNLLMDYWYLKLHVSKKNTNTNWKLRCISERRWKRAADSRTFDRQARRKTDFPERGTSTKAAVFQIHSRWYYYMPWLQHSWLCFEQVLVQVFECGSLLRRLGLLQRTPRWDH